MKYLKTFENHDTFSSIEYNHQVSTLNAKKMKYFTDQEKKIIETKLGSVALMMDFTASFEIREDGLSWRVPYSDVPTYAPAIPGRPSPHDDKAGMKYDGPGDVYKFEYGTLRIPKDENGNRYNLKLNKNDNNYYYAKLQIFGDNIDSVIKTYEIDERDGLKDWFDEFITWYSMKDRPSIPEFSS